MSSSSNDRDLVVIAPNILIWKGNRLSCAIGAGGARHDKREGDGATPIGFFPLRRVLYRPDRLAPPETVLRVAPLSPNDGWCDDPGHASYNQQVSLPFDGRCERLWREDHVYDVIVVLGYNDDPVVTGKGSAIFLHVAKPEFAPTEGCVALTQADLLSVLAQCESDACVRVKAF